METGRKRTGISVPRTNVARRPTLFGQVCVMGILGAALSCATEPSRDASAEIAVANRFRAQHNKRNSNSDLFFDIAYLVDHIDGQKDQQH